MLDKEASLLNKGLHWRSLMFIIPDARGKVALPPYIVILLFINPIVSYIEVTKMLKQTIYVCLYNFERKKKEPAPENFLRLCLPSRK